MAPLPDPRAEPRGSALPEHAPSTGERLFVSENTVKTHSSRLFDKLEFNRRVQAVLKGRELGLIP